MKKGRKFMSIVTNSKIIMIIISWAAVLFWMLLIFYLSSQVAEQSNNLSKGVTKIIVETVEKVTPEKDFNMDTINHFVRKNAHFFAYLTLGILVLNAIRRSRMNGSTISGVATLAMAFGICVLYAISDEVHQLFVPGRGGQVKDILIDSSGAIVGIGLYMIIAKTREGKTWTWGQV